MGTCDTFMNGAGLYCLSIAGLDTVRRYLNVINIEHIFDCRERHTPGRAHDEAQCLGLPTGMKYSVMPIERLSNGFYNKRSGEATGLRFLNEYPCAFRPVFRALAAGKQVIWANKKHKHTRKQQRRQVSIA